MLLLHIPTRHLYGFAQLVWGEWLSKGCLRPLRPLWPANELLLRGRPRSPAVGRALHTPLALHKANMTMFPGRPGRLVAGLITCVLLVACFSSSSLPLAQAEQDALQVCEPVLEVVVGQA